MATTTAAEIRQKFNLHYDNILSGDAPGINDYELSLLLTQAYREIIYNYYKGTISGESVDQTEYVKALLSDITKPGSVSGASLVVSTDPLTSNLTYTYAVLPTDAWLLLKESVKIGDRPTIVKPINQDEFWILVENPFRSPNKYRAWRLDESRTNPTSREVLLISSETVQKYNFSYIQKLKPIVLSTLSNIMTGLVIEGVSIESIPDPIKTNEWLRDLVINRAVELATRDYKGNDLQSQIVTNSRVE